MTPIRCVKFRGIWRQCNPNHARVVVGAQDPRSPHRGRRLLRQAESRPRLLDTKQHRNCDERGKQPKRNEIHDATIRLALHNFLPVLRRGGDFSPSMKKMQAGPSRHRRLWEREARGNWAQQIALGAALFEFFRRRLSMSERCLRVCCPANECWSFRPKIAGDII